MNTGDTLVVAAVVLWFTWLWLTAMLEDTRPPIRRHTKRHRRP